MKEDFDIMFPDNRESGETTLRQTQLVMLRLLKIVHYLCNKHNVKYFLIGGTSIGAVRHQGFIPWDDDIDIAMTRENYISFLQTCVPELPHDIFFQTPDTDEHYPHFDYVDAKLRDKYSNYTHLGESSNKYHEGLQLDIFVYDKAFLPSKLMIILENILINKISKNTKSRISILNTISKLLPFELVYGNNWMHSLGMMKLKVGPTYIQEDEIHNLIKVRFEDTEAYIPEKYDILLKRQFGNYMQVPPIEKQISHHNVSVDPFTPCDHSEVLHWKDRITNTKIID